RAAGKHKSWAPRPRSIGGSKAARCSTRARATSPSTPTSTAAAATTISSRAIPIFSPPIPRRPSTATTPPPRFIRKGRRSAAPTCSTAATWAPPSPAPARSTMFPPWKGPTNGRIALEQVKYTSRGEFRPHSSAIDAIRYWAGAVEYHHDELGIGDTGIDGIQATFNNHAQEARSEIQFMPMATPLGPPLSVVGGQFDRQHADTSGDAGSLLGQARTNRAAGYFLNQLWFTDTLRLVSAGRVEPVRIDGTAGIFRRGWCRRRIIRRWCS